MLVNHTGSFIEGGSFADTGVTGRKLMTDSYGGVCRLGGGAFSGKTPPRLTALARIWRGRAPAPSGLRSRTPFR